MRVHGENGEVVLALTLISVAVGLVLAVAYHLLANRFQTWAARHAGPGSAGITVLGFIVRLTVITVVLVLLGFFTPLNIIAVCLAFVALFSILNGWFVYRLMSKRRGAPPSAGANGLT